MHHSFLSEEELAAATLDELSERSESGAKLHCLGTLATAGGTLAIVATLEHSVGDWRRLMPWVLLVAIASAMLYVAIVRNRAVPRTARAINLAILPCALSGLIVGSAGWFDLSSMQHDSYAYAMCAATLAFCAGTTANLSPLSVLIAATIVPAISSVSVSLLVTGNPAPALCALIVLGIILRPLPQMRRNIDELVRARLLAEHASNHDPLTGVRNRAGLQLSTVGALLYGDVDHFKQVNDRYGHTVGDQVLRELASRLVRVAEPYGATVARVGGDEFVVACPSASPDELTALADDVTTAMSWPFAFVGHVGFSMGYAACESSSSEPEALASLFTRADRALYQAKRAKQSE